jgi:hypothetical protein
MIEKEFMDYELALELKQLGFDEPCFAYFSESQQLHLCRFENMSDRGFVSAPTYSQAISFLYICSNKQIDISIKGSDTHEERVEKIKQGCKDLRNLQNSKSN